MKTYCKPAVCDVESAAFIAPAVHLAFAGKLRKKRAFRRLLLDTGTISRAELQAELAANVWGQLKYTDSIYFCQTYDAYRIFKAARRSVAWKARKEAQRGAVCQAAG